MGKGSKGSGMSENCTPAGKAVHTQDLLHGEPSLQCTGRWFPFLTQAI